MTSSDNYITIEILNKGIQEIKSNIQELASQRKIDIAIIDGKLTEIKSEIHITNGQLVNMKERIEDLKFFGTIGFAAIAIFIALVAIIPSFRKEKDKTEKKNEWLERDLRALIREEIAMANSVANRN